MADYNPFNPNSVVMPTLFAGRAGQVNEICGKLANLKRGIPTSFFMYGERGIGKTALASLIMHVAKLKNPDLCNLNLVASYYAVEKNQDIASVLRESLNSLTDKLDKNLLDKIGSRLGSLFKNGKFQIGSFALELEAKEREKEIILKDQVISILTNIINGFCAQPEEGNTQGTLIPCEGGNRQGILIVIDEMHNLKDIDITASLLRNIMTTLSVETLGQVSFLLIGYKEDMVKFFSSDPSSRRAFDLIELTVMPQPEAEDVLKKGFVAANVKWDSSELSKNIGSAGGYPHSIQILGRHLLEVDKDNLIDKNDWNAALFNSALELKTKDFSQMYSFNVAGTQTVKDQILVLLANKNKPMSKKEIADELKKNIYQHIPELIKKGSVRELLDKKVELHSQLLRTSILIDQIIQNRNKEQKIT